MITFLHHFLLGAAGAAAFEALKLWEIQGKLNERKFRRILRSRVLWIPLLLMLAASGFFAWAFFAGEGTVKPWNIVVVGIVARTMAREVASAGLAHTKVKLGGERLDPDAVSVKDVFL